MSVIFTSRDFVGASIIIIIILNIFIVA